MFIDVFVDANPNTAEGCGQRFKSFDAPRPVTRIRYEGALCTVEGWANPGQSCPAHAATVEDSGTGSAILIYGGDWGVRITPDGGIPFGEPYLLLSAEAIL